MLSFILSSDRDYSRQKYLEWAEQRYKQLYPSAEVIIGVDDSYKEQFCKARAINNAVKQSTGSILIIVDCDMFISKEQIDAAIAQLDTYALVTTHDKYYRLPPTTSVKLMDNPELNLTQEPLGLLEDMHRYKYVNGGIQILKRESFLKVNGYDERFVGWGGEDTAFNCAVITMCGPFLKMEGTAYHLHHNRAAGVIDYKNREQPNHNRQLRDRYLNAMSDYNIMRQLVFEWSTTDKKVDFYASEPHYLDHIVDIWNKLPNEYKGILYVGVNDEDKLEHEINMVQYALDKHSLNAIHIDNIEHNNRLLLVPGVGKRMTQLGRSLILIIHGAGQSYVSHSGKRWGPGGTGREQVYLFLNPNEYCHTLNTTHYPKAKSKIIGCPKMDKWHQQVLMNDIKERGETPVVAISFHFESNVCQESRSAFPFFEHALLMLAHKNATREWKVIGHGHPRMMSTLEPYYKKLDIEVVTDFDEVMERADLYIMDHMSTLYEFASTKRPVVVLNAPWYRRHIEHGHRFWKYADVGINCNHPDQLEQCIIEALQDPLEQRMRRERAVSAIYQYRDGMCSDRAVEAIIEVAEHYTPQSAPVVNINNSLHKTHHSVRPERQQQLQRWFR